MWPAKVLQPSRWEKSVMVNRVAVCCIVLLATFVFASAATSADKRLIVKNEPKTDAKSWWAFQAVSKPNVPEPKGRDWARSEIDRFVLDKLERTGLQPVADAVPLVLLRRVYVDLIGLPPTPEEARAFSAAWQAARNPQTVLAATVDRLLASPQFGERWGRHWLDVARFAESSGKDVNVVFPHAWRYRDYVIRSFNDDVPYNRFLREQIAGDLLPAKDDAERARHIIAAGFLALGAKSLNEITPRQFAVDVADEQIDTVSQAILGLTIACARCHDHKFDPISQREYTALAGIFLSTETRFGTPGGVQGRNLSTLVELPKGAAAAVVAKGMTREERQRKQERLDRLREQQRQALAARAGGKTPTDGLTNFDVVRIITQATQTEVDLSGVYADGSPKPLAMSVADKPLVAPPVPKGPGRRRASGFEAIGDSPLFGRGDIANPGDQVARGIPPLFASVPSPAIPKSASGRLELAEWLTDPRNPLTARVMVNRTWHWLFGRGLVASVDNFGTMGAAPSHPELLDYLAGRFVADGWSFKKLVRAIVLSRTYQLAATHHEKSFAVDPDNALLWRHSSRRLDAESIRDAMLAAAGSLDLKAPVASLIGRAGDGPIGGERFQAITEEQVAKADHSHRSIYLPIARNVQPDLLAVFDFPDAASVCGSRGVTNVPNQALFFLNGDFAAQQSVRLAERVLRSNPGGTLEQFDVRFERACGLVLGRPPDPAEKAAARRLLARYPQDALAGWTHLVHGLFATAEFRQLD
jgi:hypothetical protein